MDTRRVGKGIATYDSLIRLHRHIHQARYHAAGRVNLLCIDISLNVNFVVALDNHRDFFKRSVSGTFADTVDGNFHLACTIQNTCNRIGSGHTQVIVAVSGKDCIFNAVYMVYQVFNLSPIFRRQTITGRIRYIDYRSSCLDNSFYYTRQIFIVRTTGIFCIELYIVYKTTGIFHGSYRTFDNFFTIRVELIFNV